MKVIVVGCGLIGLTTAYFLRSRGYEVTVLDREGGAGRQGSFANGGLLTPSMAEPWNTPGCWRVLLASLGRSDTALQVRVSELPKLARWGVTFLRNSKAAVFEMNARTNLRLALYSLEVMDSLRKETGIEYGRTALGSLRIFRDSESLDRAGVVAQSRLSEGLNFRMLSSNEVIELEPKLSAIANKLAGAIHYEADETGDAYRFCSVLAGHARQRGVEFCFGAEVSSLEVRSGRVAALVGQQRRYVADQYVIAAGSYSASLLRTCGVRLPVQPVKGYSITFEDVRGDDLISIPVVDDHLHAVIVPFPGAIRVAGTAEFAGYNRTVRAERIHNLTRLIQAVLPQARFDLATGNPWCGLRPMSADGVPIIGRTPFSNLFVNTGHGHLGWTMAAGSAQLLSDLMSGDKPSITSAPVALSRFTATS